MKKQQILDKLEQAWGEFTESYAGLTDEQMQQPGVMEDWSVRDLMAHISWWEEEALKHLPTILAGRRPPRYSVTYGGIDAFNARMTEQRSTLALEEVRRRLVETHARLLEYIRTIPEEQFTTETRFRRRLRLHSPRSRPASGRPHQRLRLLDAAAAFPVRS